MTVMSTTTWVNASVSPTPVLCIIAQLYATLSLCIGRRAYWETKDRENRVVGSK